VKLGIESSKIEDVMKGLAILACAGLALAQTPASTPLAQSNALRIAAQNALDVEMARAKTADCPDASTTRAQEECLSAEMQKTQGNYAAFAGAIRAMLGLSYATTPGEQPVLGPTGTPLTPEQRVAEFDRLEAESKAYRETAAKAAYDQYKGGTLAPVFSLEATLKLLRLHLQEMAFLYGEELSNH
jgi:hypothetical protein